VGPPLFGHAHVPEASNRRFQLSLRRLLLGYPQLRVMRNANIHALIGVPLLRVQVGPREILMGNQRQVIYPLRVPEILTTSFPEILATWN